MINIIYYDKPGGREPVKEWLDSLEHGNRDSKKLLRSINHKLDMLESIGINLGKPHCDCLTSGRRLGYHLYELRIPFGTNTYRIFYSFYNEDIIVLLHWIQKKTRKVEKSEINLSLKRMNDWVARNG